MTTKTQKLIRFEVEGQPVECGSLKDEGRTKRWVRRVKIIATEAMLKRVEEAQDIKPARLVADKA